MHEIISIFSEASIPVIKASLKRFLAGIPGLVLFKLATTVNHAVTETRSRDDGTIRALEDLLSVPDLWNAVCMSMRFTGYKAVRLEV